MRTASFRAFQRLQLVREYLDAFRSATGIELQFVPSSVRPPCEQPADSWAGVIRRLAAPIVLEGKHVASIFSEPVMVETGGARRLGSADLQAMKRMSVTEFSGLERLLRIFSKHINVFANRYLVIPQDHDAKWVVCVKERMEQEFAGPITERDAARIAALKPGQFRAKFQKATGMTFREFLTRVRVQKAMDALRSPAVSAEQVACTCGFSSVAQFHRAFREHTGATPAEFRLSVERERTASKGQRVSPGANGESVHKSVERSAPPSPVS